MGHTLLGSLPDTHPWQQVTSFLASDASVDQIADVTTRAAIEGLQLAKDDAGYHHAVSLLVEVVRASDADDFASALKQVGVETSPSPSVLELTSAVVEAGDRYLAHKGNRTDFGEMALLAAAESITALAAGGTSGLFEHSPPAKYAVATLANEKGFARLGQDFFARFMTRFLNYHLSRELSNHVGACRRFMAPNAQTDFVQQMEIHCRQAARPIREYAGKWYGKHVYQGDTAETTAGFAAHALTKLQDLMIVRGHRDA
ncbi:MAG: hypothetical protein WD534_06355 [Phycisphaeraceae bacterium]